ncbi:MAG: hypothetical protein JWP19_695 [Rhodoglobus sp.]|nr:hypothetical protein [Rhodoglobus sp.]
MKVLGVADSDSYVKWGATMLDRMPASWQRSLAVIRTPALPSRGQLASALSGSRFTVADTAIVDLADLARLVATEKPDVVLLSVRGPVVRVLIRAIVASSTVRPVIVSGLPGISIPETLKALYYRSQVDYFLLHSKREIRAFSALGEQLGIEQEFGLATLPFLLPRHPDAKHGTDIVFAPQAKVPKHLFSRKRMLDWLVETARNHPDRRVVIKLRGVVGEAQTHAERYPYDVLLAHLDDAPDNLVVSTGSMSGHLADAGALVTVSSTAALEAIAAGVPVLAVDEFGVSARLINLVFEDSGLLGGSDALIAADFRHPNEHWLDDNYFHGPSDENWVAGIEAAVSRRAAGELPLRPQFRGSLGGNLRRIWDRKRALGPYDRSLLGYVALAVGLPLRSLVRTYRRARARVRRDSEASPKELARVP